MCLAIPSKIIKIDGVEAEVEVGGVKKRANLTFIEKPAIGDYVLMHAGFAIKKISDKDARETLDIWDKLK